MLKTYSFIVLFIVSTSIYGQGFQSEKDSIISIVQSNLAQVLTRIPIGNEIYFGFTKRAEFQQCTSGKPIRVLSLNSKGNLIKLNQWRVPIILNGDYKVLFTIQKIRKTFEIVDIGGTKLAEEIQLVNKSNTIENLIRLYNLHIDFVSDDTIFEMDSNTQIHPLQSAKSWIGVGKDTYTIEELKELIKNK